MKRARLFSILLLAGLPAAAQNSTIQGIVTDESKAVMPGVQISVANVATGVGATALTNSSGFYSVPFLTPGAYKLQASMTGFASITRDNLQLDVDQTARVDFTLKVGAVAEKVEVSAASVLI